MALLFVLATYMVSKCSYFMLNGDNKLKVKLVEMYALAMRVMQWKQACNLNWLDVGKMFRDCSHV
jgi:hypothetical protein